MKLQPIIKPCLAAALLACSVSSFAQVLTVTNDLRLWLRADAGVTTGPSGAVIQWDDQSTNANHATQGLEAAAPVLVNAALNNRPVLRFDGTDDFLDVADSESLSFTGDMTTLFVVKVDDFDWYRAIWAKSGGPNGNLPAPTDIYTDPGSGVIRMYRGDGTANNLGTVASAQPLRVNTYLVLGIDVQGETLTHYLNAQPNGSGTITTNTADGNTPLKIGTRTDGVTRLKGDIAELLIYSRALSGTERSNAFNYLQTKYNLLNLPPTVTLTSNPTGPNVNVGDTVTLTAVPVDLDGTIARVEFLGNGAPVGTATAPPYTVNAVINSAGTIEFTARAVDNRDGVGTSNPVLLTATQAGPTTLPVTDGLQLWLDAGAGTTTGTGDALLQWADQSGNLNNAVQINETAAPVLVPNALNGLPVVRFDGADDVMDVADSDGLSITGDLATFYVIRFSDFLTFRAIWGKTAGPTGNQPAPNDLYALPPGPGITPGQPRFFRGNGVSGPLSVTGTRAYPANSYIVAGVAATGPTVTHYFSGAANGSANISPAIADGNTALKIGSRTDGVTRMKGEMAEVLIYNRGLTAAERTAVQRYLAEKYALPGTFTAINASPTLAITSPGGVLQAPGTFNVAVNAGDADGAVTGVQIFANGVLLTNDTTSPYSATLNLTYGGQVVLSAIATDNLGARTTATSVRLCVQGPGTPAGLVGYWPLDGNATALVGPNGLPVNGPVSAADRTETPDTAMAVNGASSQRIEIPGGGGLSGAQQGTISLWAKWSGLQDGGFGGSFGAVLGRQQDGSFSANIINLNNADPDLAFVQWRHNSANATISGGTIVGRDRWTHLAVTFTTTNSQLYVDGFLDGSGAGGALPANATTPLAIGAWTGGGGAYATASIDDVAIWNRVLSQDEILDLIGGVDTTPLNLLIQPDCLTILPIMTGREIRWGSEGLLQHADNITGPWDNVGSDSPYLIPTPSPTQKFYRLISP